MSINASGFETLDLTGAKPTSIPMETIEVQISSDNLLGNYAKAFVAEAYRVAPLKAQQLDLTMEEVSNYCNYLLYQRVLSVKGDCKDFRKLKVLYVPIWIQYNLSMIGEVVIREKGLRMVPTMEASTMTFEEAAAISEKIGSLESDLQIVQDAMPRDPKGNKDVMSTALIAGYVRSIEKVEHVASTYVTAFLGMKLKEEAAMQVLYRIQYDDVAYIASVLTTEKRIFGGA